MPKKRIRFATVPLLLAVLTACDLSPNLEVRTFPVETTDEAQLASVGTLIQPYVYKERPDAPGSMAVAAGAITVRETPDNLDQIARVIAELDLSPTPTPSFRLQFQLVEANGTSESDPVIADVVEELRKALRFDGYSLVGEAHIAVTPHYRFRQRLQTAESEYYITGTLKEYEVGYALTVHLDEAHSSLQTNVGIRPDQTLVLGSVSVKDSATLFAVVRLVEV